MSSHTAPEPPQFPAGPFIESGARDERQRGAWIDEIEAFPARIRGAVSGLRDAQLDTPYRNWTIRQIVHHIADSHLNIYVRVKLALTEDRPTVKPFDESRWSELADARRADVTPSLLILDGLQPRWTYLLRSLPGEAFDREFYHPLTRATVPLWRALAHFVVWHGRHHTAQIDWVRTHRL